MQAIFEANALCCKQRFPELFAAISKAQPDAFSIELCTGRECTLKVNGRQLTSREDRKTQAQYALQHVDMMQDLHVIGFGLGDEVRLFLQSSSCRVNVHLINPGLFYALMSIDDELATLIADPRVKFSCFLPEQKLPSNAIIIVPELYLDTSFLHEDKLRLQTMLDNAYAHQHFIRRLPLLLAKVAAQADFLQHERPYLPQNFAPINTAIVLASGPSLAERIDKVKALIAAGACSIAVDTALPYLDSVGIVPQFALSVDPMSLRPLFSKLREAAPCLHKTTLIYDVCADSKLCAKFVKRCFIFSTPFIHATPTLIKPLADKLLERGTVLISALDLALQHGAHSIYLAGADFAYKGTLSHAGLKSDERIYNAATRSDLTVLGNDGQLHVTQRNFLSYKYLTEELIALHPQVRFVNLSPSGAILKGAQLEIHGRTIL